MANIVSRSLSVHQEHELLGRLEKAGLTRVLAQRVIESPSNTLAKEIIALIRGRLDFPSYFVDVEQDRVTTKHIRDGEYDFVNGIIPKLNLNFPPEERGEAWVEIFLLKFDKSENSEKRLKQMDELDFRRPTLKEGLALGAQYPGLQREGPIVILCKPWFYAPHDLPVPVLLGDDLSRNLDLFWSDELDWGLEYRFVAVRK